MRLNIGCGSNYIAGYTNVDKYEDKVDMQFALEEPWTRIKDGSVKEILASHILEQFSEHALENVLDNITKALRDDGVLKIRVPHARGVGAYMPHHGSFWTRVMFTKIENGAWHQGDRNGKLYECIKYEARVLYFKGKHIRTLLDWFASKLPKIYEAVGLFPPLEIEWWGRVCSKPECPHDGLCETAEQIGYCADGCIHVKATEKG